MKRNIIGLILVVSIILTNSGCSYFWPNDGGNKVLLVPEIIAPRTSYYTEEVARKTVIKTETMTMSNFRNTNNFSAQVDVDHMEVFDMNAEGTFSIFILDQQRLDYGKYLDYTAKVIKVPSLRSMTYGIQLTGEFDETILAQGISGIFTVISEQKDDVIAVPKSAVRQYFKDWIIGVLVDGAREDRVVKIGLIGDEKIEIIDGLSEGEYIVFK